MKIKFSAMIMFCCSVIFFSCKNNKNSSDASGTFEADEIIVSAEVSGKILELKVEEGSVLTKGQLVGYIDSTQLHLSRLQLLQNQKALLSGRPDTKTQLESLQKELENAESDRKRIENLVKGDVASQKQLDDADNRIALIKSKIDALRNTLSTTTSTINEQSGTVAIQLAQVEDQLKKCNLVNPVAGTVLTKFANEMEITTAGKPIYKVADLSKITLRAYITASQFSHVKIGDNVKVNVDSDEGKSKAYDGIVDWINDKSEFTPKTIQTKDERANLVYATKIKVKNDGFLKIGMYGEVIFNQGNNKNE
jgi:HlyD family secretion protein